MVAMTLVLVLGLAAVVGVVAAGSARRLLVDERQSVRDYQQTLETLRHIGARGASQDDASSGPAGRSAGASSSRSSRSGSARGSARASSSAATPGADVPTRSSSRAPRAAAYAARGRRTTTKLTSSTGSTGAASRPRADGPADTTGEEPAFHFDDTAAGSGVVGPPPAVREIAAGHIAAVGASGRSSDLRRPQVSVRRPRTSDAGARSRVLVAAAAAIVVLAGVATGVAVSTSSGHTPHAPAAHAAAVRPAAGKRTGAAVSATLVPVTSSSTAATYRVPASPYTVVLSASGSCWVLATNPSGTVLWTGTMAAGQSRTVPADGGVVLRLGAPWNVSLSADGRPVQLPSGFLSPFDVTFTTA